MFKKENFAKSTITDNPLAIGASALSVETGDGAKFGDTGSSNLFRGVLWGASYSAPEADADREIITAYRDSNDDFVITERGAEDTSAKEWPQGSNFMLTATAGVLDNLIERDELDASGFGFVLDENDMSSDSPTKVPSQQSVKAYVDDKLDGWIPAEEAWTYDSDDDPTYTFTISSFDATSKYSAGMRVKLTDSGTQYGIITKVVFDDPGSTITIYMGTDYDLSGGAITNPYYSTQKAPLGFPLDVTKWQVVLNSTSSRNQASPVQNTWYNAESLSIPIGSWRIFYYCLFEAYDTGATDVDCQSTLSTANNSETDIDFRASFYFTIPSGNPDIFIPTTKEKNLVLASKTTYYLNWRTTLSGITSIAIRGDRMTTKIAAVCAYL